MTIDSQLLMLEIVLDSKVMTVVEGSHRLTIHHGENMGQ